MTRVIDSRANPLLFRRVYFYFVSFTIIIYELLLFENLLLAWRASASFFNLPQGARAQVCRIFFLLFFRFVFCPCQYNCCFRNYTILNDSLDNLIKFLILSGLYFLIIMAIGLRFRKL